MAKYVVGPCIPERYVDAFYDLTALSAGWNHLSIPSKTINNVVKAWLGLGTETTW